ncbi:DNA-binding transcriptional regulator [Enterobacter cloacae]|nr:DNA-binding transcriptional regulator [Enterobacter cloacae]
MVPVHFARPRIDAGEWVALTLENPFPDAACCLTWQQNDVSPAMDWLLDYLGDGTAFNQARVNFNGLGLFTLVDDPVQQHVEGRFTQRIFRLVNGGQRRGKEAGVAHVVIADHRDILRDAQAEFIRRAERAHRHDVAAAEHRGRAMRLGDDLLHGAIARLRLEVALNNPVFRHGDQRLFHRFHETGQTASSGVTLQRTRDHANFTMTAFYQITPRHVAAFKGVINYGVGEVCARFAPVHDHHRNVAILFQHGKDRLRVFRTHYQQAVDALLRHH